MTFQIIIYLFFTFIAIIYSKSTRIIGGSEANLTQFPYQATLRGILNQNLICGGVIISNRHILTVAHCVNEGNAFVNNFIICIGEPTILDIFGNTYLPEAIKIHPEYTGSVDPVKRAIFDIAVIKLLATIDYNDYQKKVYLPTRNVLTGDVGMLSGWGSVSLSPIQFSNKLQATWMTILDLPSCSTRIDHPLSIDQFCAYQRPGVGAAIGDSGNPLIINNKVVGLLLASYPFATGEPELYINVYMHVSFIRNIIEKH